MNEIKIVICKDPLCIMEFIQIPKGQFMMGSDNHSYEQPIHDVTIDYSFLIGKYPVTQYQYQCIIGENPSRFKCDINPVETVSWGDAQQFCKKLGECYTLPSEAEWEYSCQAGTKTMFSFGDDTEMLKEYAWYKANSDGKTHRVGQLKPNNWDLYDMHGNVWEWCADSYHENYKGAPSNGSVWENKDNEKMKLLRGGSWFIYPHYCRCASRNRTARGLRNNHNGFRVVRGSVGRTS